MSAIWLGNIFSFFAALCMIVSVIQRSKKDFIGWQIGDDIFGCLTCITLSSYSAFTVCFVCFIRNLLAYQKKLTKFSTGILFCANIIVGLYVNNLGWIGYLPIIASASYTIFTYILKTAQQMRLALIFNLLLWIIHCLYIKAYPSAATNIIICTWTIWQAYTKRNAAKHKNFKEKSKKQSQPVILSFINKGIMNIIHHKKLSATSKNCPLKQH